MSEVTLTKKQQEAVDYDGKQMLIRGIAGSGKTTVLLKKANKILTKYDESIVLFTFNKTLANYAGELAKTLKSDKLKVTTFHSWAATIIKKLNTAPKKTIYGKEQMDIYIKCIEELSANSSHRFFKESKYLDFLIEEVSWMKGKGIYTKESYLNVDRAGRGNTVHVTQSDRLRIVDFFKLYQSILKEKKACDYDDFASIVYYHADSLDSVLIDNILVDEAQDLQEMQLRVLKKVANRRLVIAADKGQKIYKTSFSWKNLDINISGGRTKILDNSFRSTKQIIALASSLQQHDPICKNKDDEFVNPILPEREGPKPQLIITKDHTDELEYVATTIKNLIAKYPTWTIGVICRTNIPLKAFEKRIKSENIPCEFLSRNLGSVLTPGVKLTTFHSAKGLEFDIAIIIRLREKMVPYVDNSEDELDEEELAIERRLLYVSMTRAKSLLYLMTYGNQSRFISEMDSNLYIVQNV